VIRTTLAAEVGSLDEELRQRAAVREEKQHLQRLLSVASSVEKVESLLRIGDGATGGVVTGRTGDVDRDKLFERVAVRRFHPCLLLRITDSCHSICLLDPQQLLSHMQVTRNVMMRRLQGEFNQLRFMQKQCAGATFIDNLQPRITAIADSLSKGLT